MGKLINFLELIVKNLFLIILTFSIFLLPPFTKFVISSQEKQKISLSIKGYKLAVEVADTDIKRVTGLMYRKELAWDEGMLFIFKKPRIVGFCMKNTTIPLSIAFINEFGIITEISDLKQKSMAIKKSKMKVRYALEINQGWFKKNGIKVGDIVKGLKVD